MQAVPRRPLMLLVALVGGAVLAAAVATDAGALAWMVVAGTAACACGLVVGATARVVPAMVLALLAAAALVLAVEARDEGAAVRSFDSVELRDRE